METEVEGRQGWIGIFPGPLPNRIKVEFGVLSTITPEKSLEMTIFQARFVNAEGEENYGK